MFLYKPQLQVTIVGLFVISVAYNPNLSEKL